MAYRVLQRDPRDLDRRKAIGVTMPFSSDSVFTSTYNSIDAYKVNLYNFFMTGQGERYLNVGLGSNLITYLFSPFSDQYISNIKLTIQSEVERFFPRLKIVAVDIEEYPDENTVQVFIQYKVKGTELEGTLTLDVNR